MNVKKNEYKHFILELDEIRFILKMTSKRKLPSYGFITNGSVLQEIDIYCQSSELPH